MFAPPSKIYTVSTVMFHKDIGANFAVTNFMSHVYMFVLTKATMKLDNENTRHTQGIGIIPCRFPNCLIIYHVGPVYYCPVQPYNNISSGALKFYIGSKKFTSEPLEHCDFLTLKSFLGDHHTRLTIILTIFNSKLSISIVTETRILLSQMSVYFQNKLSHKLFISILVMFLSPD